MEINIAGVVYEEVVSKQPGWCTECCAYGKENLELCESLSNSIGADCCESPSNWKVWKIKEVKEPIKSKEKETIMQKKEIDKSKKYKTVRGVPVELVYDNYREGMEYLWVSFPEDENKFVFATNKYGENSMSGVYNLVEFNPLEELSKMPVDTLVKVTQKSTGESYFRYLHYVSPSLTGVYLFDVGATSRTTSFSGVWLEKTFTFEIIE